MKGKKDGGCHRRIESNTSAAPLTDHDIVWSST